MSTVNMHTNYFTDRWTNNLRRRRHESIVVRSESDWLSCVFTFDHLTVTTFCQLIWFWKWIQKWFKTNQQGKLLAKRALLWSAETTSFCNSSILLSAFLLSAILPFCLSAIKWFLTDFCLKAFFSQSTVSSVSLYFTEYGRVNGSAQLSD